LLLPARALAAGEYELNDSRDAAYGPLAGGTNYTATFETENDVDWYLFYVKTTAQLDISASSVGKTCGGEEAAFVELLDGDGKRVGGLYSGRPESTKHLLLTLSPGRYYLEATRYGCTGSAYRLRIDPAAAITASRECGEAIVAREAVVPQLGKLAAKLTKKEETLAKASEAVRKMKLMLGRLRAQRASRDRLHAAVRHLAATKKIRSRVTAERDEVAAVAAGVQVAVSTAEGQIAASC
jgi:hypothetical protein